MRGDQTNIRWIVAMAVSLWLAPASASASQSHAHPDGGAFGADDSSDRAAATALDLPPASALGLGDEAAVTSADVALYREFAVPTAAEVGRSIAVLPDRALTSGLPADPEADPLRAQLPEPTSIVLLLIGGVVGLVSRRRLRRRHEDRGEATSES